MATYTVKLVDHRKSTNKETAAICASVKRIMGLAFEGTKDSISVSWGAGTDKDHLVLHFVEDIASSYLKKKWSNLSPGVNASGHTRSSGTVSGTELYRTTPRGQSPLRRYGALAFHEALHNLFPHRGDQHTAFGGGIAAANIPDEDPNDTNKKWLRQGFSVRTKQVL